MTTTSPDTLDSLIHELAQERFENDTEQCYQGGVPRPTQADYTASYVPDAREFINRVLACKSTT